MIRLFNHFSRLMPVWVIIAGIIGYVKPALYTPLAPYTEWMFAATMFGIGCVLSIDDFLPVLHRPQLILLGTLSQYLIMPLGGFAIAHLLRLPDALTIGVIMTGCVPGAMASNVICYLARADVAYSIALTSTSTLLSPLMVPLMVYLLAHSIVEISFWAMMFSIIKMIIVPLAAGFAVKHFFSDAVSRWTAFFPAFSTLFIAYICGLVVALNQSSLTQITPLIFLAVVLHNIVGLGGGYAAGTLFGLTPAQRRALSIEVGMQNAGMGAVLSLKFFSAQSALVSALFASWCVITASLMAEYWNYQRKSDQ